MTARVDTNRLTKEFKEKLEEETDSEGKDEDDINRSNYIDKTSPDPDARFGRKSDAKKFYGYKKHIRIDGDSEIIEKIQVTQATLKTKRCWNL